MKSWSPLLVLLILASLHAVSNDKKQIKRSPNQSVLTFYKQVQVCEGTEDLGNEGQGSGVSAFVNLTVEDNTKRCELTVALAYEYGNDRGFAFGDKRPFDITVVPLGKTDCFVTEKEGSTFITVKKAANPKSKSKRQPMVLVENCKITEAGY